MEIISQTFNPLENKDKNIKNNKLSKDNYIDINKNIMSTNFIILINFSVIKKVKKIMGNTKFLNNNPQSHIIIKLTS